MEVDRDPDTFVKTVLTFGNKPAPSMAQIALRKTADENPAISLKKNSYMDNICDSVKTVEQAQELTKDLDKVLETGRFQVKGWVSNEDLNDCDFVKEDNALKILEGEGPEKVIGVVWNSKADNLTFTIGAGVLEKISAAERKLMKRSVLSYIARIYDPIGIAAALIITAKTGMQRLWQLGLGWNEYLPADVCNEWLKIFDQFRKLNEVTFPRSLTPREVTGSATLCIFSDASKDAFGTCAYVRWGIGEEKYDVRFLAAKSRVAPLKELSIPRLELQAAVLAARLYKSVRSESRIKFEKVVFFTDSQMWIRSESRAFKPFVSVRVGEI